MDNVPMVTTSLNNSSRLLYAIRVHTIINGAERNVACYRPDTKWMHDNMPRATRKDYINFFDKYVYSNVKFGRKYRTMYGTIAHRTTFDIDDCFKEVLARELELKLGHFLKFDSETFTPKYFPANLEDLTFVVDFVEISEPIISYLLQVGESRLAAELREHFVCINPNCVSVDEGLSLKARELLALDLDGLSKSMRGGKN